MKATSNWLENHIPDAKRIRSKYNIIIAREFNTCLCGIDKRMPWYVVEDLVFFKKMTIGSTVVMGRHTMESLNNKPLPGRVNVVLSKTLITPPEGFIIIRDIREVLMFQGTIFFIGGPSLLSLISSDYISFPEYTLFLSELNIPSVSTLQGEKIYLHDNVLFGKRKIELALSSDWLNSEISNIQLKFQGFYIK